MQVLLGKQFQIEFKNFPRNDKVKIAGFIRHVQQYGMHGLPGRNKPSDSVPNCDPDWLKKVRYAQQHNLWHYHIGIPDYADGAAGDQTSQYVLHYIKGEDFIKIVDFSEHPPFKLPAQNYLN